MATVAGVRRNPAIRTFYLRLRANGKHVKPDKFLVILNAMLHNKTHWQHLRSPPQPLPFLPCWARFLNTVAARSLLEKSQAVVRVIHERWGPIRLGSEF
jgi:hypothetical protein